MKRDYYSLASSLVELTWGNPSDWLTVEQLVEYCLDEMHPDDGTRLRYLFLLNDIQNAVNHQAPKEPYVTPAFYSQEQFEVRTHKRLIYIVETTSKTIDALTSLNLPSGVDIDIKL